MTSRLLRVDMSDGSRDFMAVATEPGLPMLDATGANYGILRRWLGGLVAEPELQTPELVSFYVRDAQRGRLEDLTCLPATPKDLRGPLKQDLEALEVGLRKAKPESANEKLLHRIVAKSLREQTADLDKSDFDCYFFKYRQPGSPWRLVWCWGYQRRDREPSRAVICSNLDCHQLFAQRPNTKRRCPACQTIATRKRRRPIAALGNLAWLLLLLLLGGALVAFLFPPRLAVEPATWVGVPGSRVDFHVADQRWLLFHRDVTGQAVLQSSDPKVVEFDGHGASALAKKLGSAQLSFRVGDRLTQAAVVVAPTTIQIEPQTVRLGVGSTAPLKVSGSYSGGQPIDVTELVQWQVSDPKVALVHGSRVQGLTPGKTKITARYLFEGADAGRESAAEIEVASVDYKSIEIKLTPAQMDVGGNTKVEVLAHDAAGQVYSLLGSSELALSVEPPEVAALEDDLVVGKLPGKAKLVARFGALKQAADFVVRGEPAVAGTLVVAPPQVEMAAGEHLDVSVISSSPADVLAESSDPAVVSIIGSQTLSAHRAGQAEVRFTQPGLQRIVKVNVKPAEYRKIEIRPAALTVAVGESKLFDVVGLTADGREVSLAPDQLTWVRQPLTANAELTRSTYEIQGRAATQAPQDLVVQYGDLPRATAQVTVTPGPAAAVADEFGVYGPITLTRPGTVVNVGAQLGGPLRLVPGQGLVVDKVAAGSPLELAGVVPASAISRINGTDITGFKQAELVDYLGQHPIGNGTVLGVTGPDGKLHDVPLGIDAVVLRPVDVLGIAPSNVSATSFDAAVKIHVRERAEYRIVDDAFKPLSTWSQHGPNADATINITHIPRAAARNSYDVYVERRIAADVKRYPFVISLSAAPK